MLATGFVSFYSGQVRSGEVLSIVQLLFAADAATNSLHSSVSSTMSLSVILCLPVVFSNSSSMQSIHLFFFLIFCHLAATILVILSSHFNRWSEALVVFSV